MPVTWYFSPRCRWPGRSTRPASLTGSCHLKTRPSRHWPRRRARVSRYASASPSADQTASRTSPSWSRPTARPPLAPSWCSFLPLPGSTAAGPTRPRGAAGSPGGRDAASVTRAGTRSGSGCGSRKRGRPAPPKTRTFPAWPRSPDPMARWSLACPTGGPGYSRSTCRRVPVLDGRLLVDAHTHVARLPTLSADWQEWARTFGSGTPLADLFDADGTPLPEAIDQHFENQGADHVLLFCEYSPKVTGTQPIEDVLPLIERNPVRFRPVANINPHLHYPPARELARQVELGAVALKIHPVHGGFDVSDRMLYPAYAWAEEHKLPVIVHCGTSTFAGSANAYADPLMLDPVFRDFPHLVVVLAHGGRGLWYQQAAFLALMRPTVWLEVSGLPPQRLADYYGSSLRRLGGKMIFGTDWPGVPGVAANARSLEKTLLDAGCTPEQVAAAWGGNAARVFGLLAPA